MTPLQIQTKKSIELLSRLYEVCDTEFQLEIATQITALEEALKS